ncbi:hypothetical protein SGQ44_15930 [Flavobacterium sp. Fl-77]|uniref:Uncharacterized protein n=1 Tax=Flavobacterium flavipigmentatum TaxID=2893884 RepID=A0AAJ2SJC5_9FLAO|nr:MULTISPECIES: hypothetical protein [unclassified Flavobacterium]MDX6183785.1 hypothetical protein [Flavobacterium sp. Fl-33]MDX6187254.1 hypothetical protein [Flavobacterium sp. Fl-77]UFH38069.1 hypothetical protein LNP22_15175 [Flavobacterium sp. F-70]
MIIGNKENFAIEFEKLNSNPEMGYGKLWLQNNFFGTKEDLIYLNGYLLSLLDEILNAKIITLNIEDKNPIELFNFLKYFGRNYLILGSTFTDDFEAYCYKSNEKIFLIWKLREVEMIFDELKNYDREIQFCNANYIEIKIVKEDFINQLNKA